MTRRVYIAGPMTGYPEYNYPAFHYAATVLRAKGFDVTNPAELHGDAPAVGDEKPWNWYLRQSLKAMLDCDELVLLPGWQESRGADLEERVANALGMPVSQWEGSSDHQEAHSGGV